MVDLIGNR